MRILLYSRAYLPRLGGLEQATHVLATALARQGVQVTVATDVQAPGDADQGLPFEVIRGRSLSELAGLSRRNDLVHSNGFSLLAVHIARRSGRPLIFTHAGLQAACLEGAGWHGGRSCGNALMRCAALTASNRGWPRMLRQLARYPVGRGALYLAAQNVCVSHFIADSIRAPRTAVIQNCVDSALFTPGAASGPRERFLFFGRFSAEKGVETVLRALALERNQGRRWALDLVGAGPQAPAYASLVEELGIGNQVCLRGMLRGQELAQAIRNSLAVVVPSSCYEAFGLVAAEAMACGRLALVSNHGGLPEVVAGVDTLVAPGDCKAWALALRRMATDEAWRATQEMKLPALAARFSPQTHVDRYLSTYRAILGTSAGAMT